MWKCRFSTQLPSVNMFGIDLNCFEGFFICSFHITFVIGFYGVEIVMFSTHRFIPLSIISVRVDERLWWAVMCMPRSIAL